MDVNQHGIAGHGSDEIGSFSVRGEVNGNSLAFAKLYWGSHTVFYRGVLDSGWRGIQGEWQIPGDSYGNFELRR